MKIIVPEGMLKAAEVEIAADGRPSFRNWDWSGDEDTLLPVVLTAALRWLSENPMMPTPAQMDELTTLIPYQDSGNGRVFRTVLDQWQCRMFLAPEPEVPEAVKDLLPFPVDVIISDGRLYRKIKEHLDFVAVEAYRRGQKAGFP